MNSYSPFWEKHEAMEGIQDKYYNFWGNDMRQTLFVRFNTLQFALATENFEKYFPTNN